MKKIAQIYVYIFLLALSSCFSSLHAIVVDFTLSLNTIVDSGLTYNNYQKAEAPSTSSFVIGFEVEVTAIDGQTVNLNPVAVFCSEIQEPISATSHSFTLDSLSGLAAGQAGATGTASSNIPSGGIGGLRAARLSYLFDNYYISEQLSAWTMTDMSPNLHAFQLAVWELTHDDDLDLYSGEVSLGVQTDGSNLTRRENARGLANDWVESVDAAGITAGYTSDKFSFWALTDIGSQDLILALEKDTSTESDFTGAIPEPSVSVLFAGCFAINLVFMRRDKRKETT
jgi:hypothetical protein